MTETRLAPSRRAVQVRALRPPPVRVRPGARSGCSEPGCCCCFRRRFDRRALLGMLLWDALVPGGVRPRAARASGGGRPHARTAVGRSPHARRAVGGHRRPDRADASVAGVGRGRRPFVAPRCVTALPSSRCRRIGPAAPQPRMRWYRASAANATAGVATVRWRGARRLAERRGIATLDQVVRVYPAREEGRRESLYLIRSRQIALEKRRARHAGAGRDFESLRDHQQGDEPRDICWSAAARRGRLVTKVYQPERSQAVWILVDAGPAVARPDRHADDARPRGDRRARRSRRSPRAPGDKVGLIAYGRRHPATRGSRRAAPPHLRRLLEALRGRQASKPSRPSHARAAGELLPPAAASRARDLAHRDRRDRRHAGGHRAERGDDAAARGRVRGPSPRRPAVDRLRGARFAAGHVPHDRRTGDAGPARCVAGRASGAGARWCWRPRRRSWASGLVDRYLEVKERGLF